MKKVASIIFYIFAALLLGYAVWAFSRSAEIISEAIEAGQITIGGNLYDIISFYMNNTGLYFVFALLLAGIGLLLHKGKNEAVSLQMDQTAKNQSDAELDEWFDEIKEA